MNRPPLLTQGLYVGRQVTFGAWPTGARLGFFWLFSLLLALASACGGETPVPSTDPPPAVEETPPPEPAGPPPSAATDADRVVLVADQGTAAGLLTRAAVRALLEEQTGEDVESIQLRQDASFLVTFAPVSPARGDAEAEGLVLELRQLPWVAKVYGYGRALPPGL